MSTPTNFRRLPGLIPVAGRKVFFQNAAIPTKPDGSLVAPLATCICPQCGHGYAELMRRAAADGDQGSDGKRICDECRVENFATSSAALTFGEANGCVAFSRRGIAADDSVAVKNALKFRTQEDIENVIGEKSATILFLYEVEGLSYRQIAKALGVNGTSVFRRLDNARRKLLDNEKALG